MKFFYRAIQIPQLGTMYEDRMRPKYSVWCTNMYIKSWIADMIIQCSLIIISLEYGGTRLWWGINASHSKLNKHGDSC